MSTEPHIPGSVDSGKPTATLKIEVIQRRTIEIGVYLPMREAWKRREELAAPFLNDTAGNPLWAVERYSIEEARFMTPVHRALADTEKPRTYTEIVRTDRGIEPVWPTEYWWCTSLTCGEPCGSDPCQFCGEPVKRYRVVPAEARL